MAVATVRCWLKLAPIMSFQDRQTGWKVTGVSQKQPRTGQAAICLDLGIEIPAPVKVDIPACIIDVGTEIDQIVKGLDGE